MTRRADFLYGVNLGGWLLLEKWMTPSVFAGTDAVDEYTFMQTTGALAKIREHQREFIREADFAWLHDNGVNAVRIPIGYWAIAGEAPYRSCVGRLDWALKMAEKYQLKVLLCLHGAPGSQNGRDHSGKIGKAEWYNEKELRNRTITHLETLALRYRDSPALWGIELLNEPRIGLFQRKLRRFYREGFRALVDILPDHVHVVFHDAFTPRFLSGVLPARGQAVAMDIHWYHFTSLFAHLPIRWYFWLLKHRAYTLRQLGMRQPVIVGEWSGVIAGRKLHQYPVTRRQELTRRHMELQLQSYQSASGWFYWSYKTEGGGTWSFRDLVEKGEFSPERT